MAVSCRNEACLSQRRNLRQVRCFSYLRFRQKLQDTCGLSRPFILGSDRDENPGVDVMCVMMSAEAWYDGFAATYNRMNYIHRAIAFLKARESCIMDHDGCRVSTSVG
jgi:hypothetical protein